jgi:tetratricopeptide (TPR) repeat protein
MSDSTHHTLHTVATIAAFAAVLGWLIVHSLRTSEDPARTLFKWIFTILVVGLVAWKVPPMMDQGGVVAFSGISMTMVGGLALAFTWRHSIGGLIARPFMSLYDGGDVPPEPRPAYSVALSRQKQGRYLEAVAEIRKQLDRFPTDFEGLMLLAQIQAENLKDIQGAELTIQRLCAQRGHAPQNITFALYSMADWHLKYSQDREAARRNLEKVVQLFPDTEFSLTAEQRIAHLGTTEKLLASHDLKKFVVPEGVRNLGLLKEPPQMKTGVDPNELAAEYVRHLTKHPQDTEVRENLAIIYADHYGRLDLARDQLEQMIQQEAQPAKLVARWLNLLADLQIRHGAGYEAVKETLQRIVDRDPKLAAAEMARRRLAMLKLELKANEKTQGVKLGSYEQKIGLNRPLPRNQF